MKIQFGRQMNDNWLQTLTLKFAEASVVDLNE